MWWRLCVREISSASASASANLDGADDDSRLSCQLIAGETDFPIIVHVADSR